MGGRGGVSDTLLTGLAPLSPAGWRSQSCLPGCCPGLAASGWLQGWRSGSISEAPIAGFGSFSLVSCGVSCCLSGFPVRGGPQCSQKSRPSLRHLEVRLWVAQGQMERGSRNRTEIETKEMRAASWTSPYLLGTYLSNLGMFSRILKVTLLIIVLKITFGLSFLITKIKYIQWKKQEQNTKIKWPESCHAEVRAHAQVQSLVCAIWCGRWGRDAVSEWPLCSLPLTSSPWPAQPWLCRCSPSLWPQAQGTCHSTAQLRGLWSWLVKENDRGIISSPLMGLRTDTWNNFGPWDALEQLWGNASLVQEIHRRWWSSRPASAKGRLWKLL